MKEEIFRKVAEIIVANNKLINTEDVRMNSTYEDLNMDSLDGITLITELENTYKVILTNEEVGEIKNISDAVNAIEKKLAEQ